MAGKYSVRNAHVGFWTDLTVKFVDMVCISITMYLCQECCMWCNLSKKNVYLYSSFIQIYFILRVGTLDCFLISSMLNSKM